MVDQEEARQALWLETQVTCSSGQALRLTETRHHRLGRLIGSDGDSRGDVGDDARIAGQLELDSAAVAVAERAAAAASAAARHDVVQVVAVRVAVDDVIGAEQVVAVVTAGIASRLT